MQRGIWIGVLIVSMGLAGLMWSARTAPGPEAAIRADAAPAASSQPPPVGTAPARLPTPAAAQPLPTPSPAADEPVAEEATSLEAARLAAIQSDARLLDRAKQLELAPKADARWNEAVSESGFTADDVDPAVRKLFASVRLEPRYAEGGAIEGLVIEEMGDDHPLARAGFRIGDRLSRIQGVELRDPSQLPSLIAHLGPNISFCVERDGGETCQDVALD